MWARDDLTQTNIDKHLILASDWEKKTIYTEWIGRQESFAEYSLTENDSPIMETSLYLHIQTLIGCFC